MLGEAIAVGGIVTVGALFARWVKTNGVYSVPWSDITQTQLEAHQKLAIAMADRAHLDPACRELLRHQVKLLKAVGIVGKEIVDVTPTTETPPKLQEAPKKEVEWIRTKNGIRRADYGGDGEAEGFGYYPRDAETEL